jgi:hypothetical protein
VSIKLTIVSRLFSSEINKHQINKFCIVKINIQIHPKKVNCKSAQNYQLKGCYMIYQVLGFHVLLGDESKQGLQKPLAKSYFLASGNPSHLNHII